MGLGFGFGVGLGGFLPFQHGQEEPHSQSVWGAHPQVLRGALITQYLDSLSPLVSELELVPGACGGIGACNAVALALLDNAVSSSARTATPGDAHTAMKNSKESIRSGNRKVLMVRILHFPYILCALRTLLWAGGDHPGGYRAIGDRLVTGQYPHAVIAP